MCVNELVLFVSSKVVSKRTGRDFTVVLVLYSTFSMVLHVKCFQLNFSCVSNVACFCV